MASFTIPVSNKGGEFETPPEGNQPATCVALIDLGTQRTDYNGEVRWQRQVNGEVRWQRQVYLVWELAHEVMAGTKDSRHLIGRNYTFSLGKKALLRSVVEGWRGKDLAEDSDFDLANVLGKPCLVNVIHKKANSGNTYAKVEGVKAVPKGMTVPRPQRKPFARLLDSADAVPDWVPYLIGRPVAEVIADCQERAGNGKEAPPAGPAEEPDGAPAGYNDIPF
jgi:hypothetical protein